WQSGNQKNGPFQSRCIALVRCVSFPNLPSATIFAGAAWGFLMRPVLCDSLTRCGQYQSPTRVHRGWEFSLAEVARELRCLRPGCSKSRSRSVNNRTQPDSKAYCSASWCLLPQRRVIQTGNRQMRLREIGIETVLLAFKMLVYLPA